MIQDFKRQMLHIELEQYEVKMQQYEYEFEQEWTAFQLETSQTQSWYQMSEWNMFKNFINTYLYHNTNLWIRAIRYKESCVHVKLLQQYHRQRLPTQKNIDVYPQIIVDMAKISLNRIELDYLSRHGRLNVLSNHNLIHKTYY